MEFNPFIKGHIYKRSIIHDKFGGSRQSGISPTKEHPYIFIFSGDAGHQHGYKDQWENESIFSYTGEGQKNDMQFTRGNLALLEQAKNGKRIFLFIHSERSYVRFDSELEFLDFDYFVGKDSLGNDRTSIKFFFKRAGLEIGYQIPEFETSTLAEKFEFNLPNKTERSGLVTSRVGQGAYRKSLLHRWKYQCAVTTYTKKEILIASHIVPWKDSTDNERLDVNNGIILSPTYDALFDQHLISFENSGKIILSDTILASDLSLLGVTGLERIHNLNEENYHYLERHRIF